MVRLECDSPFLTKSSDRSHFDPNAELLSVRVSLVCESNAGFSIRALTKIHMWFLTWKGLTGAALFFLLIWSILMVSHAHRSRTHNLLAS